MRVSNNTRVQIGDQSDGSGRIMRGSNWVSCVTTFRIVGSSTFHGVGRATIVVVLTQNFDVLTFLEVKKRRETNIAHDIWHTTVLGSKLERFEELISHSLSIEIMKDDFSVYYVNPEGFNLRVHVVDRQNIFHNLDWKNRCLKELFGEDN